MKTQLSIMVLLMSQIFFAQNFVVIKTENYTGVIIPKEYFPKNKNLNSFTPNETEIVLLETELNKARNNKKIPQYDIPEEPYLSENLKKYYRQYSGFFLNNEKCFTVNFIPITNILTAEEIKKWNSEYIECQNCFAVNFNNETKRFYFIGKCDE